MRERFRRNCAHLIAEACDGHREKSTAVFVPVHWIADWNAAFCRFTQYVPAAQLRTSEAGADRAHIEAELVAVQPSLTEIYGLFKVDGAAVWLRGDGNSAEVRVSPGIKPGPEIHSVDTGIGARMIESLMTDPKLIAQASVVPLMGPLS